MRILLTGTSGQVGGALLPLLNASHVVLAPQRAELDLSQPETVDEALDGLAPDLIVNPAAYTAVDKAEDEPELALRVNAASPAAMAAWAAKRNVPLIHFSTDYVFDGSGETPWREEDECAPLSSYGRSKWEGERAIRSSGAPHLILRTSWVYAARGTNFLRTMVRLARERDELRVVADQFGSPTAAASIAEATLTIIGRRKRTEDLAKDFEATQGLVHLANAGTTSWHGFATAIVDGLKVRGQPVKAAAVHAIATSDFPTKAIRPANSRLDTSRLRQAFGVSMPAWNQALHRELDRLVQLG
ncbi:dTDP-4-dehydrorhamnose reductase [Bradyrhizobium symbiodeficiens]|uniref:dTDP-4-dehydrorhamnose reductase n=1 Tax=Bradyrhizobium symbiodeficiens TaxID=1404367 RepID=UPI00140FE2D1|nr:dTDP-4-dehydrorhamnose reductase [Bradyrhizobium symbiodeficiens]QIO98844.1 dTDP-4-dehydrorhamnose reductase [Bradyrhizobium symbiodeficiens]